MTGKLAVVLGEDDNPGYRSGSPTKSWKLSERLECNFIYADFSSKGGPKDLVDNWEDVVPQNELMHKPLYLAALYHLHTKTFPLFYTIQSVQIL